MFYVSSLKKDLIGITDTEDGVEEFYTPKQLSDNFSYKTIRSIVGVGHKAVKCYSGRKVYTDFYTLGEFYVAKPKEIKAILSSSCYKEFASILGNNVISNLHLSQDGIETRLGIWFSDYSDRSLLIHVEYKDGLYYIASYDEFVELELDEEDEDSYEDGELLGEQAFLFTDDVRWECVDEESLNDSYQSLKDLIDSVEQDFEIELNID